uniref:3'(2'),5'-bisphosphate nucleotidase n=1 Tax=Bionectria ochroleuca TaxID=29856 RepID=A0A0B7JTW6_BIOOC
MDSPRRRELEVAIAAVQAAARLTQHVINSKDKGFVEKNDATLVTVADFASQALLMATIKAAFPGDLIVGEEDASQLREDPALQDEVYALLQWLGTSEEEEGRDGWKVPESRDRMCDLLDEGGSSSPSRSGRTWIFDPVDGTKTYIRGELYAINVALLEDGKQSVSVVGCPNLGINAKAPIVNGDISPSGIIVFGVKHHGAYVRPIEGRPEDVEIRKLPQISPDLTSADLRLVTCETLNDSWTALALALGNTTVWVYRRLERRGKIWDHAGAMLLFEETGGRVTDVHGGDIDVTAGRTMTDNFGFVGAPRGLHSQVLGAVHAELRGQGHTAHLGPCA